ncbi:MAG: esterase [Bacteroidales bacterium]|nr:esterase [Bacteroidales bacterium]
MKKIILLILAATLTAASLSAGTFRTETIEDQNMTRIYHLYLPDNYKEGSPLVFILHGYGGNAEGYQQAFLPLAEEFGFVLCYPQGSPDYKGKNGWNVGYPSQKASMTVDDCKFIYHLTKHLQKTYKLSLKNTFFSGMSNGGEMCYLMAYRYPELFGAIASIAGLTLVEMAEKYEYKTPVPFMEVHGTTDKTSRWEGDPTNQYGWGAYLSVPVAVGAIVALNKCMFEEVTELPLIKNQVILHRYYGSPYGKEVRFYEVRGGGHNWAADSFDTHRTVLEFFQSNLR